MVVLCSCSGGQAEQPGQMGCRAQAPSTSARSAGQLSEPSYPSTYYHIVIRSPQVKGKTPDYSHEDAFHDASHPGSAGIGTHGIPLATSSPGTFSHYWHSTCVLGKTMSDPHLAAALPKPAWSGASLPAAALRWFQLDCLPTCRQHVPTPAWRYFLADLS